MHCPEISDCASKVGVLPRVSRTSGGKVRLLIKPIVITLLMP